MRLKFDHAHFILALALVVTLFATAVQTNANTRARADATRYKQFALWALYHAKSEVLDFANKNANVQRNIEKHLTPEIISAIQGARLLPPLPPERTITPQPEEPVDMDTLAEVLASRYGTGGS